MGGGGDGSGGSAMPDSTESERTPSCAACDDVGSKRHGVRSGHAAHAALAISWRWQPQYEREVALNA